MKKKAAAVIGGVAVAGGIAAATVAPAQAESGHNYDIHRVHVVEGWTGTNCLSLYGPGTHDRGTVGHATDCSAALTFTWDYAAAPGEWIGVDPEMGANSSIACAVYIDGYLMSDDYAAAGDGHNATCLTRL